MHRARPSPATRATSSPVAGGACGDPDIWFTSVESFAKILSERNRELLTLIAERRPDSLDSLAAARGRARSNLSRTPQTMARYGWVRLEKGEGRKLRPVVTFEKVELPPSYGLSGRGTLRRNRRQ